MENFLKTHIIKTKENILKILEGLRKWSLTVIGLLIYGGVVWFQSRTGIVTDFLGLGLGIGFLLTPTVVGNIFEHLAKVKVPK